MKISPTIKQTANTSTTIRVIGGKSRMVHFIPHLTVRFRAKYTTFFPQ